MHVCFSCVIFCFRGFYTCTCIANITYRFGVGDTKATKQATLCEMLPVEEEEAGEGWRRC